MAPFEMLHSAGRDTIITAQPLRADGRQDTALPAPRSAARGIVIGLGLSAVLWVVIAWAIIGLMRS